MTEQTPQAAALAVRLHFDDITAAGTGGEIVYLAGWPATEQGAQPLLGALPRGATPMLMLRSAAAETAGEPLFVTAQTLGPALRRLHAAGDVPLALTVVARRLSQPLLGLLSTLPADPGGALELTLSEMPGADVLAQALPRWQRDKAADETGSICLVPDPGTSDALPDADLLGALAATSGALLPPAQSALARVALTEASDLVAGFSITGAEFDEHEITGTAEGPGDGADRPLPSVMAFSSGEAVAMAPLRPEGAGYSFRMELPRGFLFDGAEDSVELRLAVPQVSAEATGVALPRRRLVSAERLLEFDVAGSDTPSRRKPFGIVLYSFTRTEGAMLVLESLKRQGALEHVEIWMDGDQGKPAVKKALENAEEEFRDFGIDRITRHRGNLGFRKLILQSLMYMADTYDRFIVLEDDCFPSGVAVEEFIRALDKHADDPEVLTTYGHHFLVPAEQPLCPRFQGWGWATWSDKIRPFIAELAYLFSLRESEFTAWTQSVMTPEILARLDCTAPRGASITLQRFFAWDETLALLAALADMKHAPTDTRCIYNFGVGEDSTHFSNIDWYRKPPFNMILKSEVWDHY